MEWSKIDEENETVHCVSCGEVLGYLVVSTGDIAVRCLACGKEGED